VADSSSDLDFISNFGWSTVVMTKHWGLIMVWNWRVTKVLILLSLLGWFSQWCILKDLESPSEASSTIIVWMILSVLLAQKTWNLHLKLWADIYLSWGNQCADFLTNMGHSGQTGLLYLPVPPPLIFLIFNDCRGISFPRFEP